MQYRTLGRTGIKVSPYALGALALGTYIGNTDTGDSIRGPASHNDLVGIRPTIGLTSNADPRKPRRCRLIQRSTLNSSAGWPSMSFPIICSCSTQGVAAPQSNFPAKTRGMRGPSGSLCYPWP